MEVITVEKYPPNGFPVRQKRLQLFTPRGLDAPPTKPWLSLRHTCMAFTHWLHLGSAVRNPLEKECWLPFASVIAVKKNRKRRNLDQVDAAMHSLFCIKERKILPNRGAQGAPPPSQVLESPSAICRCGKMMWWFNVIHILDVNPSEIVTNSRSFLGDVLEIYIGLLLFVQIYPDLLGLEESRFNGAHLSCNFSTVRFWVRFTVDACTCFARQKSIHLHERYLDCNTEAEYIYIYRRIYTIQRLLYRTGRCGGVNLVQKSS